MDMETCRAATAPASRTASIADWLRRDAVIVISAILVLVLAAARIAIKLPLDLKTTGDSAAYLIQASFRPPLYGWILNGWRTLTGNLHHFPLLQFMMMDLGLLVFVVEFGRLYRNALIGLALIPLVLMHPAIYDAPRWMMTETVYLAVVLAGLGMQLRYVRNGAPECLVAAAVFFGMATLTRSTGFAFLPLPLLAAFFDSRWTMRVALSNGSKAGAAAALVLIAGMSWNFSRHGRFEIGSWTGLSLLQKSLFLVKPADVATLPPPVAIVAPVAAAERKLVAEQPDLSARLRTELQVTSSDLRWGVFVPQAAGTWPAWRSSDWRERGVLGGQISRVLIHRHPSGYLKLWFNDWLTLVLQPAYWPAWSTTVIKDRDDFAACRLQHSCWALDRYDLPLRNLVTLLGPSMAGPLAGFFMLICLAGRVLRRNATPESVLFWSMALVLHAGLLLSSAFEAGHIRMTVAFHVLDLAILMYLLVNMLRRLASRRPILPKLFMAG